MLGVAAMKSITEIDVHDSFKEAGMWPMDFRFVQWFRRTWHDLEETVGRELRRMEEGGLQQEFLQSFRDDRIVLQ